MEIRVTWDNNNLASVDKKAAMSSEERLLELKPEVFEHGLLVDTVRTEFYTYGIVIDDNNEFQEILINRLIHVNEYEDDEYTES